MTIAEIFTVFIPTIPLFITAMILLPKRLTKYYVVVKHYYLDEYLYIKNPDTLELTPDISLAWHGAFHTAGLLMDKFAFEGPSYYVASLHKKVQWVQLDNQPTKEIE